MSGRLRPLSTPAPRRLPSTIQSDDRLWCSSSLIPFQATRQSDELLEWATNWSQSSPACLLYGPTASGKSRLIEWLSQELGSHVVEIDCASAASVRDVTGTAEEATKCRSVGNFASPAGAAFASSKSSMVVLEHVDSLLARPGGQVPAALLALVSAARVPTLMTANTACFPPSPWLRSIRCAKSRDPFRVLTRAVWMVGTAHLLDVQGEIRAILAFTDNDIRRAALQYQARRGCHGLVDRREELWLSAPIAAAERQFDRHFFSNFCDCLLYADCDDVFFDPYVRPLGSRLFSKEREDALQGRFEFIQAKIPLDTPCRAEGRRRNPSCDTCRSAKPAEEQAASNGASGSSFL
jgi:hypothetical protein